MPASADVNKEIDHPSMAAAAWLNAGAQLSAKTTENLLALGFEGVCVQAITIGGLAPVEEVRMRLDRIDR